MSYISIKNLCNCKNCGKDYDVEYSEIYLKGNLYFCSAKCIVEYEKQSKE